MGKSIVFVENGITRKKRPRDYSAYLAYYKSIGDGDNKHFNAKAYNCDGAYISQTTGYVDIVVEYYGEDLTVALSSYASALIFNEDYPVLSANGVVTTLGDSIYEDMIPVFLTKIERTAFQSFEREDGKNYASYRVSFEVDWWTYSLSPDTSIQFRGNIQRAHVNDIKLSSGDYKDNPYYTLIENEEEVSKPIVDSVALKNIVNNSEYPDIRICYVILSSSKNSSSTSPVLYTGDAIPTIGLHSPDYSYEPPYYLGVIAICKGRPFIGYKLNDKTTSDIRIMRAIETPAHISDSRVIAMFESEVHGFSITTQSAKINGATITYYEICFNDPTVSWTYDPYTTEANPYLDFSIDIVTSTSQLGYYLIKDKQPTSFESNSALCFELGFIKEIPLYFRNLRIKNKRPHFNKNLPTKYSNYTGYLYSGIRKQFWSCYDTWSIKCMDSVINIPLEYCVINDSDSLLMSMNIDGIGNGYLAYLSVDYLYGTTCLRQIICNGEFYPIKIEDEYTATALATESTANRLNVLNAYLKAGSNVVSSAVSGFISGSIFGGGLIGAGIGLASSIPNAAANISIAENTYIGEQKRLEKLQRDGYYGVNISKGNSFNHISPLSLVHSYPNSYNIEVIQEHLAMYGYNTWLDLSELLPKHNRKYFNFIKTYNCEVLTGLADNVRISIETMFNNGVWLFSEYAFTNPYKGDDSDGLGSFTLKCPNMQEDFE